MSINYNGSYWKNVKRRQLTIKKSLKILVQRNGKNILKTLIRTIKYQNQEIEEMKQKLNSVEKDTVLMSLIIQY